VSEKRLIGVIDMIKVVVIALGILLFLICCASNLSNQIYLEKSDKTNTQKAIQNIQREKASIKNTKGVAVLNIYNEDGSLWYKFTFYFDDSNGKFPYTNNDFKPFAFQPDYFLLVLKCIERKDNFAEVVVNEETGMRKYIKVDDPVFKFETWEELTLNAFAIDFNRKENPVLETPEGKVKRLDSMDQVTFRAVEIKGDWLKICWDNTEQKANKGKTDNVGWIKWKHEEVMLISLYYFA
jgi:uncharacterized protein YcfL